MSRLIVPVCVSWEVLRRMEANNPSQSLPGSLFGKAAVLPDKVHANELVTVTHRCGWEGEWPRHALREMRESVTEALAAAIFRPYLVGDLYLVKRNIWREVCDHGSRDWDAWDDLGRGRGRTGRVVAARTLDTTPYIFLEHTTGGIAPVEGGVDPSARYRMGWWKPSNLLPVQDVICARCTGAGHVGVRATPCEACEGTGIALVEERTLPPVGPDYTASDRAYLRRRARRLRD